MKTSKLGKGIKIASTVIGGLAAIGAILKWKLWKSIGDFLCPIFKLKLPDFLLLILIVVILAWLIYLSIKFRGFSNKNMKEILSDNKRFIEINEELKVKANEIISTNKSQMSKINSFNRVMEEIRKKFNVDQELNDNTLEGFLDAFYPDKPKSDMKDIKSLREQLNKCEENFASLRSKYQKTIGYLDIIEETYYPDGRKFKQHQVVRHIILDLMNDAYWDERRGNQPDDLIELKEIIREEIKSS